MGMRDLSDAYICPRATDPTNKGIQIKQIMNVHVTSNRYVSLPALYKLPKLANDCSACLYNNCD